MAMRAIVETRRILRISVKVSGAVGNDKDLMNVVSTLTTAINTIVAINSTLKIIGKLKGMGTNNIFLGFLNGGSEETTLDTFLDIG